MANLNFEFDVTLASGTTQKYTKTITLGGFIGMAAEAEVGAGASATATLSVTSTKNPDGSVLIVESIALTDNLPFLPASYNIVLGQETVASGLEADIAVAAASAVNGSTAVVKMTVSA